MGKRAIQPQARLGYGEGKEMSAKAWSKETPRIDGVYWWRMHEYDPFPIVCETDLEFDFVYDMGEPLGDKISERKGEWCGPINPPIF